jgi:hypothetical protein
MMIETEVKQAPDWQTLSVVIKELGLTKLKLNRIIKQHHLRVKVSIRDARFKLVDINAVRRLLEMDTA